ncbi:hypothetical protein [Pseudoduganella sp. HUAS MS19]
MALKTSEIAGFSKSMVRPRLGPDFFTHTNRDMVRCRGPFLETVFFAKKRSGWLHVIPTFFVVGADPAASVIFQTMSLPLNGIDETGKWRFRPETLLDEALATHIVAQIERDSPLTFIGPLKDDAIDSALRTFVRQIVHPVPSLSLAFFNMCRGAPSARSELAATRKRFLKMSRYGSGKPPLDSEQAMLARLDELAARLDSPDCIAICRDEVIEHARNLNISVPEWPTDWPASAVYAPQESGGAWWTKLFRQG